MGVTATGIWYKSNTTAGTTLDVNWYDGVNWRSTAAGSSTLTATVPSSEAGCDITIRNATVASPSYDQRMLLRGVESRNSVANNQITLGTLYFTTQSLPSGVTATKWAFDTTETTVNGSGQTVPKTQYLNFSRSGSLPFVAVAATAQAEFSANVILVSTQTIRILASTSIVIFNAVDPNTVFSLESGTTQWSDWKLGPSINIPGGASNGTKYRWKGTSAVVGGSAFGDLNVQQSLGVYEIDFPFSATVQGNGTKVDYAVVYPSVTPSSMSGIYLITAASVRLVQNSITLGSPSKIQLGSDGMLQYYGYNEALTMPSTTIEGAGIIDYLGSNYSNRVQAPAAVMNAFYGEFSVQHGLLVLRATLGGIVTGLQNFSFANSNPTQAYAGTKEAPSGFNYSGRRDSIVTSSTWGAATNAYTRVPQMLTVALRASANLIVDQVADEFGTIIPRRTVKFTSDGTYPSGFAFTNAPSRFFRATISIQYDGPMLVDCGSDFFYQTAPYKKTEHSCSTAQYGTFNNGPVSNVALTINAGSVVRFNTYSGSVGGTVLFKNPIRGDFTVEDSVSFILQDSAQLLGSKYKFVSGVFRFYSATNIGLTGDANDNANTAFRFDNAGLSAAYPATYEFAGTSADCVASGKPIVLNSGTCQILSTGTKALKIKLSSIFLPYDINAAAPATYTLNLGGASTADNALLGMVPQNCVMSVDGWTYAAYPETEPAQVNINKNDAGRWIIGNGTTTNGDVVINAGELAISSTLGEAVLGAVNGIALKTVSLKSSTAVLRTFSGDSVLNANRQLGRTTLGYLVVGTPTYGDPTHNIYTAGSTSGTLFIGGA